MNLHSRETVKLDQNLRRKTTELKDAALLANFSREDLVAIEAEYHNNRPVAYRFHLKF